MPHRSPILSALVLLLAGTTLACGNEKDAAVAARGDRTATASTASTGGGPASRVRAEERAAFDAAAPGVVGKVAGAPSMAPAPASPPPPPIAESPTLPSGAAGAAETTATAAPAMLIRTGQASVEVDSLEPALAAVRALAQRMGGYVANTSLAVGREQVRSATLQLKVPSARFDALVGGLAPLGRVETVNVNAEDVGEEYVDIAARVANARRLEARLLTLLERNAPRLSDVLAVERELARVREEIERAEGRLRYLRTRVALSTLDVTVHERAPILAGTPSRNPLLEALRQAWRNLVAVLAFAIASLGVLIPVAVVLVVAWRYGRPWLRRAEKP